MSVIRAWTSALIMIALSAPVALGQTIPGTVQPGAVERTLQPQLPQLRNDRIEVPAPAGFGNPSGAENFHFTLRKVDVEGARVISKDRLSPAYSGLIGHDVSLAQIFAVARQITAEYARSGYALSFALVPAQKIDRADGVVRIDVVEGYVSDLRYYGDAARVPAILKDYGARILGYRPLKTAVLERFLLLMNDLPGYTANAVFERIADAPRGATRLVVKLVLRRIVAQASIDNRGSKAFGPWEASAEVALNSILNQGESIILRGVRALNSNQLNAGLVKASITLGDNGLALALTATYSDAHPGSATLAALHFASSGWTAAGQLTYPVLRSRPQSLWIWAGASAKWLRSDLAATPNSRDHIYAAEAGATWNERDSGGIAAADVTLAQGLDVFDATPSKSLLRSRAAGSGVYTAVNADVTRLQRIAQVSAGTVDLFAAISGQLASRGLLSPDQCGYGGPVFGRAFDSNEIVGDHCLMSSLELRFSPAVDFARWSADQVQFFAVADAGEVWNVGQLGYGDRRSEGGASVGAGVRLRLFAHVNASVEYDQPLGQPVALEGNRDGRLFAELSIEN